MSLCSFSWLLPLTFYLQSSLMLSAPVYLESNTDIEFAYTTGTNEFLYVFADGADQTYRISPLAFAITLRSHIPMASPVPFSVTIRLDDAAWPTNNTFNVETLLQSLGMNVGNAGWGGIYYKYADGCAVHCDWSNIQKTHSIFIREPTRRPTPSPTKYPTDNPTTPFPSTSPTTASPTKFPTMPPTKFPSVSPTTPPSVPPTRTPTDFPTKQPSVFPTTSPTLKPTAFPSVAPSKSPTHGPTLHPTSSPTRDPTTDPTKSPTPLTLNPSVTPTRNPTASPSTDPTTSPSSNPTLQPTQNPTSFPTRTAAPTTSPTKQPSLNPTMGPTMSPSATPTKSPTRFPTSLNPTQSPSASPTTGSPTMTPTHYQSGITSYIPIHLQDNMETKFAYSLGTKAFYYVFPDRGQQIYTFNANAVSITISSWIPQASPTPWYVTITPADAVWPNNHAFNVEVLLQTIGRNVKNQGWGGIFYKYGDGCAVHCDWSFINKIHTIYVAVPTDVPTTSPTAQPTSSPIMPSAPTTAVPTRIPTSIPTATPSVSPSNQPSMSPSARPTLAPSVWVNPYCPAAHALELMGNTGNTAYSEFAECRESGAYAVDFEGKLTCRTMACCLCEEIRCGVGSEYGGCTRLMIGERGAIGVPAIRIQSAFLFDVFQPGAYFYCDAVESCKNTVISGGLISRGQCNGAYSCQNTQISIEPAEKMAFSCGGLKSCAGSSIEITIGQTSEIRTIESIVFSAEKSAQGTVFTLRNLSRNYVTIKRLECRTESCTETSISVEGLVYVESCMMPGQRTVRLSGPSGVIEPCIQQQPNYINIV